MEEVTFGLCGWCMLRGVFFLPAFTGLGHKYQGLLSWCDGLHVCTDWALGSYFHVKECWRIVRAPLNSKGKISSTGGSEEG